MLTRTSNNKISPGWRKLLLTVHVVVSVSVIGTDLILITLGIAGLTSETPELIQASYLSMELLVETVVIPLALGALLTGVVLGIGTRWGLTRYYWVLGKLVLTIVAITALVFLLRPKINQAATEILKIPLADLATTGIGAVGIVVTVGPTVAFLILITITILAIYKPWGKILLKKT